MARTLRLMIRLYQGARFGRPSPCRFVPSCSEYANEAIELHGGMRGCWLAVRRICRCHPFGGHGSDPVPPVSPRHSQGHAATPQVGVHGARTHSH